MNQTLSSPTQVLIRLYYDTYESYDLSYFVFFLILFFCVYIVLASYMWQSRAVHCKPDSCQESHHLHYVVIKNSHK
jgi:hypothetical protein